MTTPAATTCPTDRTDASGRSRSLRRLGLVGGIGPESTISYYRAITSGVLERSPGRVLPPLVIDSINVYEVLRLTAERDLESAGRILLASIERLAAAGAEAVALTGVTAHAVLDIIRDRLPVPVLTIADAVAEDARRRGIRHAVLLGTLPTMRDDFFRKPLAEGGLATTVPAAMEQEFIEHCIETELEPGVVRAETREAVEEIAADLMEKADADAVILGCTELPLLWRDSPAPFPVINAAEVHAEALIRYILE